MAALTLAIVTCRVLVSFGCRYRPSGAILLGDYSAGNAASYVFTKASGVFIEDGWYQHFPT
ncbi:hypothetical protein O9992_15905 [Vibrio lentus]|nr:hypothetical protein [Vibrio lentus]